MYNSHAIVKPNNFTIQQAPVTSRPVTARPLSSLNRKPFQSSPIYRARTTTGAPESFSAVDIETIDDATTKAPRQRFVVKRKFRPTTKV